MSVPTSDDQRDTVPFNFGDDDLDIGIGGSVVHTLDGMEIGRACDNGRYFPTECRNKGARESMLWHRLVVGVERGQGGSKLKTTTTIRNHSHVICRVAS